MSTAHERTMSSRRRNEDGTFPQRRRQESEGRKEGKTKSVARKERGRRVYPRVTAIDLMRKMLGAAQKSTPRGEVAYIQGSSLFVCFVFAKATLRRPRSRSLSSSSSSSFFPTSAAPYSLFPLHPPPSPLYGIPISVSRATPRAHFQRVSIH